MKKSICFFCLEEVKIGLTVLFRSAADKCSAPLSPISFNPRYNLVSVCVKKSIFIFCVEEEKIQLTVLFRSTADKCSAPLSPISFSLRLSVLSVCVKKSIYVFCVERNENSTHCVVSKYSRQMFCSFISDFIVVEIECVECLCEKVDLCLLCLKKRKFDSLCCFEVP